MYLPCKHTCKLLKGPKSRKGFQALRGRCTNENMDFDLEGIKWEVRRTLELTEEPSSELMGSKRKTRVRKEVEAQDNLCVGSSIL